MGKKGKTEERKKEVEDEDGEGIKKNPEQICPYLFGILLNSFPNHICSEFFLTPSPTSPPYTNFTSAKYDLQY